MKNAIEEFTEEDQPFLSHDKITDVDVSAIIPKEELKILQESVLLNESYKQLEGNPHNIN